MKYQMLHTCIRVMDLEKSLKFYEDAFGFVERTRKDFPEQEFTLVFLRDASSGCEIELTYNYNADQPYDIGNGFSHIGVSVEDLEGSRQKHQKMGYKVSELMGLPGSQPRFYFVTDPDGYEIEVIRSK